MMKQNRNGSRACCAKGVETEGLVIVKARRGEATDTHSIAERRFSQARRAKIRMRMKLLQSLVPGCDKITGKAHVLDETIKYVQFLQNQVESLAAKIAIVDHPLFGCQHNVNKNASASEGMLPYLPESSAVSFMCSADTMPSDPASLVLTQNQEANVIPQANQKQVQ